MKNYLRKGDEIPFTQVANSVLNDKNITLQAKGLFAYIYSKPDGWDFSSERIARDCKNGIRAVKNILNELEEAGYLKRQRRKTGKMMYVISHNKSYQNAEMPQCGNSTEEKCHSAETAQISNKENYNNKELNSNTDLATSTEFAVNGSQPVNEKHVGQLIDVFKKSVNPTIPFGHKTFRAAAKELIAQFGIEKALAMTTAAVGVQGEMYAPVITNPYQLKVRLAELGVFLQRKGSDNKMITI